MSFWDDKKPPKEDFATKDDIEKMKRDFERLLKDKDEPDTKGATYKMAKSIGKGISDIAKSLSDPASDKRPRIARMQKKKAPIARPNTTSPLAGRNPGIKRGKISYAPDD